MFAQTHPIPKLIYRIREGDLQAALRLSQDEEAARNRALEDANSRALFDDQNQMMCVGFLYNTFERTS
jgi:hypothetical protein